MSDTEENLSVEDILSSIKNILVDDEGAPIESAIPEIETPKEEPASAPAVEEAADVFNLDDSMIITPEPEAPAAESSIEQPVETPAEAAPEEVAVPEVSVENTISLDDISDLNNLLEMPSTEEAPAKAEESSFPTSIQDIVNSITLEEPAAPAKKEPEQAGPVVREETIDTSASLINNFAKVFAEKQREQAQLKLNSQLTEEVVAKAIEDKLESLNVASLVQEEILSQVKTQAGNLFEPMAKKIITELTQKWIESNLQQVVEKAVSAEIERVIAKVEI